MFKKCGTVETGVLEISNHETFHSALLMRLVLTNSHPGAPVNEVAMKSQAKSETEG